MSWSQALIAYFFGPFLVLGTISLVVREVGKHRHSFPQRGGHTHPSYFSSARRVDPS
jgi:hypothetical protein